VSAEVRSKNDLTESALLEMSGYATNQELSENPSAFEARVGIHTMNDEKAPAGD
jgi:hypothetical protein